MGKSKRIRSDRAQDVMTSPERYSDIKAAKSAKKTTVILICVIAAIILASVALIIFNETGSLARSKVLYESENFKINGAMATYMYMDVYQQYYSMYGQYAQYFMSSDVTTLIGAKTILARCEAAKAAGYELTQADLDEIDNSIKELKAAVKESGNTISDLYGDGITAKDIKDVLKLKKLASKIYEDKEAEFEDKILADKDRLNKYFEENKSDFLKGDYIKVKVNEEYYEKLKAADSAEKFKEVFIEYYAKENLLTNYNSAAKTENKAEILDDSVYKTVCAIVAYYVCEKEIEGVTLPDALELDDVSVTADKFTEVYNKFKADADVVTSAMIETLAKVASEMCDKANKAISVKTGYAYPDDTSSSSTTTTTTTTTAATTTTKATEGDKTNPEGGEEGKENEENKETVPTDSEIAAAFEKWFFEEGRKDNDVYAAEDEKTVFFVTKAAVKETYATKNVGHILIKVNDTKDKAAMAEALKKATELRDQLKAGTLTKDEFEKVANENTADSGVFYDNVMKGKMVSSFEDWIYDEARKEGDIDIVETEYGYHVMYFVGDGLEAWVATALENLLSDDITAWNTALLTQFPVTAVEKNIKKIFG